MHESYVMPPYEKGKCKHRTLRIGEAGSRAFDATGTRDVTDTSQAFTQTLAGWILVPALVGLRVVWPPSLTPTPSSCYCAKPRENILASGSGSSGMYVRHGSGLCNSACKRSSDLDWCSVTPRTYKIVRLPYAHRFSGEFGQI